MNYPTPHINCTPSDFAKTVLMPGDPLRAKFIAENFLESPRLVNNVRGIQGYTGRFEGEMISVMASGMGMPSIAIYSYELYSAFGVENIFRVGTAGAMQEHIKIGDVLLGQGACTDSGMAKNYRLPGTFAPIASFEMLSVAQEEARKMGLCYHVGNLLSSDVFYSDEEDLSSEMKKCAAWRKMGVMAVEMEAAALYMNAARLKKKALAICTVSDHLITGEETTSLQRQESFTDMMLLALRSAMRL